MAQCPECGARLRLVAASGGGVARPRVPGGWPDTHADEMAQWMRGDDGALVRVFPQEQV